MSLFTMQAGTAAQTAEGSGGFSAQILIFAGMLAAALIICFRGYKIYRLALWLLGFIVGFSLMHQLIDLLGIPFLSEHRQIAPLIAGLILGSVSAALVRIGVFLTAWHFIKQILAVPVANLILTALEKKTQIPVFVTPLLTNIIGLLAAWLFAKFAVKSLRPTIVILTALAGGFAAVSLFFALPELLHFEVPFLTNLPALYRSGASLFLAGAGAATQGFKGKEK